MNVVLVTDRIIDLSLERQLIPSFRVCTPDEDFNSSDVTALLVWHEHISRSYISQYPNLRFIVRYGVGFDNIDLNFARSNGITCVNTPDYGVDEVAQTALSFILGISRGSFWYSLNPCSASLWTNPSPLPISRSSSTTVGIIGAGRIGSKLALYLRSLDFQVCIYDPYIESGFEKVLNCVRVNSLQELLGASDFVSINCPLTDSTRGLVNHDFIASMKPGSSLINTARGCIFSDDILQHVLHYIQSSFMVLCNRCPPC